MDFGWSSVVNYLFHNSCMKGKEVMRAGLKFLAVAIPLIAGCSQESKMRALEEQVAVLEKKLIASEKSIEKIEQRNNTNELVTKIERIAYLTPSSSGYAIVKMDLGNLTVSFANVSGYANGSKVKLQFGNLTSATIEGLKATLEWGAVDEEGKPKNSEAKSREIVFNESLSPGAWNNAEVVLDGVPPASLGFIRVKNLSHRAIRLRGG